MIKNRNHGPHRPSALVLSIKRGLDFNDVPKKINFSPYNHRVSMMISLKINGIHHELDSDPSTPLLWVIREQIGLTGTKFGCGIAQCGACTVHLNGLPIRSCTTPLGSVIDQEITTIEGITASSI